jgi:hypothetical protein
VTASSTNATHNPAQHQSVTVNVTTSLASQLGMMSSPVDRGMCTWQSLLKQTCHAPQITCGVPCSLSVACDKMPQSMHRKKHRTLAHDVHIVNKGDMQELLLPLTVINHNPQALQPS